MPSAKILARFKRLEGEKIGNLETINQGIGGSAAAVPVTTAQSWYVAVTDQTNVIFTSGHPGYIQGSVTVTGSVSTTTNITQWNSVNLGSPSNFGTSPGAVAVPGSNASIYAGTTGLTATGSSLNVNITGGGSGGTQYVDETAETAGAFTGTAALMYNGTQVRAIRADSSDNLLMNINAQSLTALKVSATSGANAVGNPIFIEVSDGTNAMGAMTNFGVTPTGVKALVTNSEGFATYNASPIANPSTGAFVPQQSDLNGNLKVMPGLTTQTLTVWTSVNFTSGGPFTVVLAANLACPALILQLNQTGTLTTGAVTFQGTYDSTNWVTIPAQYVLDPTSSTFAQLTIPYTFVTSTNKAFLIVNPGYQQIRATCSTTLTGSGTVSPFVTQLAVSPVSITSAVGSSGNSAASATGSGVPANASYDGINVAGTLRGATGVNPTGAVYALQTDLASVNGTSMGTPVGFGSTPSGNSLSTNSVIFGFTGSTLVPVTANQPGGGAGNCLAIDLSASLGTTLGAPQTVGTAPVGKTIGTQAVLFANDSGIQLLSSKPFASVSVGTGEALNVNACINGTSGSGGTVVGASTAFGGTVINAGSLQTNAALFASVSGTQTALTGTGTALDVNLKGSSTGNAPAAASVGVASASAVSSNASRKGLVLTNTSANTISLGFGANAAVLNSGITLVPNSVFVMDAYTFTTAAVNAIASGASSNLAIQEMQ